MSQILLVITIIDFRNDCSTIHIRNLTLIVKPYLEQNTFSKNWLQRNIEQCTTKSIHNIPHVWIEYFSSPSINLNSLFSFSFHRFDMSIFLLQDWVPLTEKRAQSALITREKYIHALSIARCERNEIRPVISFSTSIF